MPTLDNKKRKKGIRFTDGKKKRTSASEQKDPQQVQRSLVDFAHVHGLPIPILAPLCFEEKPTYAVIGSTVPKKPAGNVVETGPVDYDPKTFRLTIPYAPLEAVNLLTSLLPGKMKFTLLPNNFYTSGITLPAQDHSIIDGTLYYATQAAMKKDTWSVTLDLNQIFYLSKFDVYNDVTIATVLQVPNLIDIILQYAITPGANLRPLYEKNSTRVTYVL